MIRSVSSRIYTIKLKYKVGEYPRVFVTDPFPLERYPGKDLLEHVYSTPNQELCLFMKSTGEWTRQKMIAKTVIPWAAEWLQFYELWLSTGEWYGEGMHPQVKDKKKKDKKK